MNNCENCQLLNRRAKTIPNQPRPPGIHHGYSLIDNSKLIKKQSASNPLQSIPKSSASIKSYENPEEKEMRTFDIKSPLNEQLTSQTFTLNVTLTSSGLASSTSTHIGPKSKADLV